MPFKEALAWFGLTVVGISGYFVVERYVSPAGWIILTVIGLAAVGYAVYHHHRPESPNPPVWVLLLVLTWFGVGYDYYDRHLAPEVPEFDEPASDPVQSFGHSLTDCHAMVTGDRFWRYRNDYQLALACFFENSSVDQMQLPLIVGNTYSITKGTMAISAVHKPLDFVGGLNFVVLLVPNSVHISEFTTMKQARALGVLIKTGGSQTNVRQIVP